MKSFVIMFVLAFAIASADIVDVDDFDKQDKAETECNALFPGYKDSRDKIIVAVVSGERVLFTNTTVWCHLNCVLQKIGFSDEKSNIRTQAVFKYHMQGLPELAAYSDVFLIQLFQIHRSTKDIEDKCLKAYVTYNRFIESLLVLTLSNNIQNDFNIKGAIVNATEEEKSLPAELKEKVKLYLKKTNAMLKFGAATLLGTAASTESPIPIPAPAPSDSSPITNTDKLPDTLGKPSL